MNKFLKKISKFFVFIYLIIAFSVVIWALNDIYNEPVISKWNGDQDGTKNQNILSENFIDGKLMVTDEEGNQKEVGNYNKVNESYTVSLQTFGYIGTSESGTPLNDFDEETSKEFYGFDIDGDGNENPDYKLAIDVWKVTMPLNVLITVIPGYDNAKIISPNIELVNQSELDANVFIREMRLVGEDNGIEFVTNKSEIDNSVGDQDKRDKLYLAVTPADEIKNGFEFEESSMADIIVKKEESSPGNNNMIKLGTLEKINGKITAGRFKFSGKANKEFLAEHTTVLESADGNNGSTTTEPYNYRLFYRFKRAPVEKPNID